MLLMSLLSLGHETDKKKPNQFALTTMPYTCMPICQRCVFSCHTYIEQESLWFTLRGERMWRDLTNQGVGVANQIV